MNNSDPDFTGIFVSDASATAIIDMGSANAPLWGRHRAKLVLKKTAEYSALETNNQAPKSQLELIDFIEDWKDNIVFYDDKDVPIELSAVITAIRKLTVSKITDATSDKGDFKASTSVYDEIEFKSQGGVLPKGFKFNCQPYADFHPVMFDCRLRMQGGDKLLLRYRIQQWEILTECIVDEFKNLLSEKINNKSAAFYCGTMEYQNKV